jgi:hypothetical protein
MFIRFFDGGLDPIQTTGQSLWLILCISAFSSVIRSKTYCTYSTYCGYLSRSERLEISIISKFFHFYSGFCTLSVSLFRQNRSNIDWLLSFYDLQVNAGLKISGKVNFAFLCLSLSYVICLQCCENTQNQCCGPVTFLYGSGSADSYL